MLKLQEFILNDKDWKDKLSEAPYCLDIRISKSEDSDLDGLYLFKYGIGSDMSEPICQESRGIILDSRNNFQIVCHPFHKFFNVHEENAHTIDWNTAKVQEKVDGSIIKLWYYSGKWRWSTNGSIDAYATDLYEKNSKFPTFGSLIDFALSPDNRKWLNSLSIFNTYMFELTSPFNRIVVPYTETYLYFLGAKNTLTGEEYGNDVQLLNGGGFFVKPVKTYNFSSQEETEEAVKALPFSEEGYVVVDTNFNRVKIKSPAYVEAHHIRGEGLTVKRVLPMILSGEDEEYLSYFPEDKDYFDSIRMAYNNLLNRWNGLIEQYKEKESEFSNPKERAEWVKTTGYPPLVFGYINGKIKNAEEHFERLFPPNKLFFVSEELNESKQS